MSIGAVKLTIPAEIALSLRSQRAPVSARATGGLRTSHMTYRLCMKCGGYDHGA